MILKIIATGIVCSLICILLKRTAKEYVIFVQLSFAVFAGVIIIKECMTFFDELSSYFSLADNLDGLYSVLCKGAFICIACKIACDISIESGNVLVSDLIELAGKTVMIVLAMPLIKDIIRTAISFVS